MRGGVSYEMSSTCVQGGIRPLGGYQPNMLMGPSSPASAWQYQSIIPKREPIDPEERNNDSGLVSGSDFVSSSPGSDKSENFPANQMVTSTPHAFYSTPTGVYQQPQLSPVTSESYNTLKLDTPCASPGDNSQPNDNPEDALKKLQASLEKNGFLPQAMSPKFGEWSADDDNNSDKEPEEYDEQGLRIPKVNSHGKIKTFKCKQCDFVAITKLVFWEHTKTHIKADKLLTCPKCPFVTEYKHHLEYHLRNHFGSKPFKCTQCSYSCVNKSMLNSHLKSHSNIYQYRCSDCSYATKYCHSLKLHLRKYSHKPAMVLNPDGTPNPLPIIDVYGTRRGPKMKSQPSEGKSQQEETKPKVEQQQQPPLPFALNQFMPQLPFPGFPFFAGFPGAIPNSLLMQNLETIARERRESACSPEQFETEQGVLDLSKPEGPVKHRRKGTAYKLSSNGEASSEEEDDDGTTTMFGNVEVVETKMEDSQPEKEADDSSAGKAKEDYNCQYCRINFGEPVLYTMHMGYHGYNNPFTCNMCGEECKDKVSFFLHIARTPHS
ncbi:unnamed protein product [Phyllotreta striolata]|uniref:Protein hunchback n=1 Tax=Phyllotreta striolata TaxID=444603 RepID=A0A9N9XSK5_PHYSR|nr:unnamed protein product [Phyllotreta striolata]